MPVAREERTAPKPGWPSRSRCSACTFSKTRSPPATSPARGATPPSGRERTTITTRTVSTPRAGTAKKRSSSATGTSARPTSTGRERPSRSVCPSSWRRAGRTRRRPATWRARRFRRRSRTGRSTFAARRRCRSGTAPESLNTVSPGACSLTTPIPFRGPGYAALPRFRAEIGPFLGVASGGAVLWSERGVHTRLGRRRAGAAGRGRASRPGARRASRLERGRPRLRRSRVHQPVALLRRMSAVLGTILCSSSSFRGLRRARDSSSVCACRSGSSRATSCSPRRCWRSRIPKRSRRWPSRPPTAG